MNTYLCKGTRTIVSMETITKHLFELQDIKYRDFSAKLVPTVDINSIIGVRTPQLRAYAKELSTSSIRYQFLKELPHKYMEENSLHAMLLCTISKDINEVFGYINEFLPYIDNWATCDTFAPKIFKKFPAEVEIKIHQWLKSAHTYTVRFGVVSALQFFLDDHFNPQMLTTLANIHTNEYYINMAIAWYYSFALIKQYDFTIQLFEAQTLDRWIHNKSIQKAVESYRVSDERKQYLRTLKIK